MIETAVREGVEVRRFARKDATVTEVFSVRVKDVDGTRRRRSFDSLEDALDYRARLRSARRCIEAEIRDAADRAASDLPAEGNRDARPR